MKKAVILFTSCLLFLFHHGMSQRFAVGVVAESRDAELKSTDKVNGKKYYTGLPITLKKGMGLCFYMESSVFIPAIYFFSPGKGTYFGNAGTDRTKSSDKALNTFIAPADSTFFVVLTSVNNGMTGAFHYGYYLLDSSQMMFSNDYSICERFGYLLNHWLANWNLIPKTYKLETNDDDDDISYNEYYTTINTLVKGKTATITRVYEEMMYVKSFEVLGKAGKESREFYKQVCDAIKTCLDQNAWTIETEGMLGEDGPFDVASRSTAVTYFTAKGALRDEHQKSFKVIWSPPGANLWSSNRYGNEYTVKLVLNCPPLKQNTLPGVLFCPGSKNSFVLLN